MNRDFIWRELHGGLWHTTHPDRFRDILTRGAIIPEPDIPNSERWKASKEPEFYPYVRTLGGSASLTLTTSNPKAIRKNFD